MSRRNDPLKIHRAQRAGVRQRLIDEQRLNPETAEAWVLAWERQAAGDGIATHGAAYWDADWTWITAERVKRREPIWPSG